MRLFSVVTAAAAALLMASCVQATSPTAPPLPPASAAPPPVAAPAVAAPAAKIEITDASFSGIRDMTPVRGFYVSNLTGDHAATIKVAQAGTGDYPVGSLVQLVPTEAMVKREPGYSAATKDWEFLELDVSASATKIRVRGTTEAVNKFGGNCLACHIKARPEFDLICEQGHGCDPIPVTPVMAKAIQNTDPRCAPMELPPEQIAALKALAAFMAPRPAPAPTPAQ